MLMLFQIKFSVKLMHLFHYNDRLTLKVIIFLLRGQVNVKLVLVQLDIWLFKIADHVSFDTLELSLEMAMHLLPASFEHHIGEKCLCECGILASSY